MLTMNTHLHPALAALKDRRLFCQQALIGGQWCDAASGHWLAVHDPASGTVLGHVPDMGGPDAEAAIAAAERAFHDWRKVPHATRAALLERWFALIQAHADDLALILTLEQGKPLAEATGEIAYGASFVQWFAQEALRIEGGLIPAPTTDRRILTLKQPVGVCAIITPWNFPNAMITRKVAPALAAGCTVVIKPSDLTPFSALALAVLAERAGIPAGVINLVTGYPAHIGAKLTASPIVRKVSFTGSTRVGALLMQQSAPSIKRLSLELGGNAPFIVFDDADLEAAVEGVMVSKFRNGGQTCVCANRILVQAGIYHAFAERLAERVTALQVGPGLEADVQIGPMINAAAIDKINRHIADAVAHGAIVHAQAAIPDTPAEAHYATPTVLTHCTTAMALAQEETFGPVAPLFRFETEAEALSLANNTPFGLAAYFYTTDMARAWRMGEALEAGMVGLNTGSVSMTISPFGGIKQSGLGREGARMGIDEYLEVKAFHMAGLG